MNDNTTPRPPRFPTHRFWLVCTGEIEDVSFMPDFTGHTDPKLSPTGQLQAEAIARELAAVAPAATVIYSSPLAAAHATATAIAEAMAIATVEMHQSLVTVMPETLPPGPDGLAAHAMIQERAWSLLETLKERYEPDVSIIIVSHELPIRALIARALAIPLSDADRFGLDAASISAIEFRGPRAIISVLNDRCHVG